MNHQDVLHKAQQQQIRLVRFQYCDTSSIIRSKATHINKLATRISEGIGQSVAMSAWTCIDTLVDVAEMGPVGEFRLVPDPQTFSILPYTPQSASMMCDLVATDGKPWGACPRSFLTRMITRLAQHGIRLEAAIEHEFYLARQQSDGSYIPADRSLAYSTIGLDEQASFIQRLLDALDQQGIAVELFHTEGGPAQQELSIHHAEALTAADHVCLVRETIRGVARSCDLLASFAPKPFLNEFGSGAHIHWSLWEADDHQTPGKNLLYAADSPDSLSTLGRHFIAGVLQHIHGLVALTCGSVNSYGRLLPHHWSSAYNVWGFNNREAAVRVIPPAWGQGADSLNLELKCSDHSGNPYLALGAIIAAGLDGIERQLDPGAPTQIDPGNYREQERSQREITRLPASLDKAINALERDAILQEALGPLLTKAYIAVKRAEISFFQEKSPEEIAFRHFSIY